MPTITAELAVIPTPSSYITFLHSSLILSSLSPPPTHSPLPSLRSAGWSWRLELEWCERKILLPGWWLKLERCERKKL